MTTFIKQLMVGALVSLLPMVLWANSYVFNTTDYDIDVVWIAAGCAGVKTSLGCGDLTDSGTRATRFSPSAVSLGTPIFMDKADSDYGN